MQINYYTYICGNDAIEHEHQNHNTITKILFFDYREKKTTPKTEKNSDKVKCAASINASSKFRIRPYSTLDQFQ